MSWIKIFFNPRKYAREINEIRTLLTQHEEYSDTIELEINNLKNEYNLLQQQFTQSAEENNKLNQTITLLTSQLAQTREELSDNRAKLQQAENDLEIIDELQDLFALCQEKINNYELRIEKLNSALNDAKKTIAKNASAEEYNEITLINNTNLNPATTKSDNTKQSKPLSVNRHIDTQLPENSDNLFQPKEAQSSPHRNVDTTVSDKTDNRRNKQSQKSNTSDNISFSSTPSIDDWLKPLPDDII